MNKAIAKIVSFFKNLRKPKKPLYTYKWFPNEMPKTEGDTIEQCPHVASGQREVRASVIVSPTRVRDVCEECYDKTLKRKRSPTMLIGKVKHPEPPSKFFKSQTAHAKRLWKKGSKLEDDN
jgi:hypothetical protein